MDQGNRPLLWTSLPDPTIEYFYPERFTDSGLTVADAVVTDWLDIIHPDDRAGLIAKWKMALQTGTAYEADARLRRHDGECHLFRNRAEPQRNGKKHVTRWNGATISVAPPTQREGAVPDQAGLYDVSDKRLLELVKTHHQMTRVCLSNGHAHSAHDFIDTAALLLELVEARQNLRDYRVAAKVDRSRRQQSSSR